MQPLSMGSRLQTEFEQELIVGKKLGEGGQGIVYEVVCGDAHKALKWYTVDEIINNEDFVKNLRNNITAGPPAKAKNFLWPQDLVRTNEGGLGYVMDLVPPGWIEMKDILIDPSQVPNYYRHVVDACLQLVVAFDALHNDGYCYQDINDGNFFMDPKTGSVLICDCDNVAPGGKSLGILGHPDFMAPEVVTQESMPTVRSDLHSLAVLIYYLLVFAHPLVGKRGVIRDPQRDRRLFGTDPLFVFDPQSTANEPMPTDKNARINWVCLPRHMQDIFREAFSSEALRDPNRRPSERRWLGELASLRSEIVTCHCGNEVFLQGVGPRRCDRCGAVHSAPLRLELVFAGGTRPLVPVVRDARVYACQLGLGTSSLDPLVLVVASKDDLLRLGIMNSGTDSIEVKVGTRVHELAPRRVVRAMEGIKMRIPGMREGEFLRVGKNS